MPSSLATSGTVAPPASLASASRSLRTICSGECRLPIESPPSSALEWLDSHSSWISFRGAGQADPRLDEEEKEKRINWAHEAVALVRGLSVELAARIITGELPPR